MLPTEPNRRLLDDHSGVQGEDLKHSVRRRRIDVPKGISRAPSLGRRVGGGCASGANQMRRLVARRHRTACGTTAAASALARLPVGEGAQGLRKCEHAPSLEEDLFRVPQSVLGPGDCRTKARCMFQICRTPKHVGAAVVKHWKCLFELLPTDSPLPLAFPRSYWSEPDDKRGTVGP